MTLPRLALAWVPVAAWFVIATLGIARLAPPLADGPAVAGILPRRLVIWRLVEAGLLTLFASLWFDSLGSGGWWLLFLLVGALATIPAWLPPRPVERRGLRLAGAAADVARYVVAGAILAWRLG